MSTATPDTDTLEILSPGPEPPLAPDHRLATASVVALIGDARAGSLTGTLATTLARRVGVELGFETGPGADAVEVVDLGAISMRRLAWGEGPPRDALEKVLGAKLVVVASTTQRGTYSGLLKLFLDGLPDRALAGKLAIPVMSAVAPRHAMAADVHLRPLLIELGASCPTPSLFALEARLANPSGICSSWIARARPTLSPPGPSTPSPRRSR